MSDDDFINDKPFSDAKERMRIRSATAFVEDMKPWISPFVAVGKNKRAVAGVLALIAAITYLTRPDIAAAVRLIVGGGQ